MVELVDTQDLESCEATRASSILVIRTKWHKNVCDYVVHYNISTKYMTKYTIKS